jgi:hypothetical protein
VVFNPNGCSYKFAQLFLFRYCVSNPLVSLLQLESGEHFVEVDKLLLRTANNMPQWQGHSPSDDFAMAAIDPSRDSHLHHHRHNWASKNPGVILVFCIVFVVGAGILSLFIYRKVLGKKAQKDVFTG